MPAIRQSYRALEQQAEERTRELATLLKVSGNLTSTLELEPLLRLILDQVKEVVDYTGAAVYLMDGEDALRLLVYTGPIPRDELRTYWPLRWDLVAREVIKHRESVVVPDTSAPDPLASAYRESMGRHIGYVRSWMGVPLVAKNKVIGMLGFDHTQPNFYVKHLAELALAFANQAAAAIDNARLYEEVNRRADEAQALFLVQQAITSRLDLDVVLQLIADAGLRLTNARASTVYLLEGETLRLAVSSGELGDDLHMDLRVSLNPTTSRFAFAFETGKPVLITDAQHDPRVSLDFMRHSGVQAYMVVPLVSGTQPIGVISVADKLKGSFGREDENILTMLAASAVIGLENARLYREEQARRYEAERRREIAESLRDVLTTLNSNRPLNEVLDLIVQQAGRLLGAQAAALFALESPDGLLVTRASWGLPDSYPKDARIPSESIIGKAIEARTPLYVTDISTLPVNEALEAVKARYPHLLNMLNDLLQRYKAFIALPMFIKHEAYGGIVLFYPKARQFGEEDIQLGVAFCDQAALAIENARLHDQAQKAAVDAERSRIARDLHDAVTQTLFSASLTAEVLPRLWKRDPAQGEKYLEDLRQLTRGALAEMRTLLLELRPDTLTEVDFAELLRQLSEALTGRAKIPVKLNLDGRCVLPPKVHTELYRIVQETFSNIFKHSGATEVIVNLRARPGIIELEVSDDGRGFDPAAVTAEHLGLKIMRERAESIGALLRIDSLLEHGTCVSVIWQEQTDKVD